MRQPFVQKPIQRCSLKIVFFTVRLHSTLLGFDPVLNKTVETQDRDFEKISRNNNVREILVLVACLLIFSAIFPINYLADGVSPSEAKQLRDQIDSLDTLALLMDRERFSAAVEWVGRNVRSDIGMKLQHYDDELLHLADDLAQRLLPAFDTSTGIPFGSVNLLRGVDENESKITSTAGGGGTLTLEFGVLSRLTNNPIFEEVTKNAVRGIWAQRPKFNLMGGHINVFTGEWTQKDAGIGTSIDSFYEYFLKVGKNIQKIFIEATNYVKGLAKGSQDV